MEDFPWTGFNLTPRAHMKTPSSAVHLKPTTPRAQMGARDEVLGSLHEALDKAVSLYLSEPDHPVHVQLEVTEEQARIHAAC